MNTDGNEGKSGKRKAEKWEGQAVRNMFQDETLENFFIVSP